MQVKPDWNLIYPLSEFYEQLGLSLPSVARVEGQDIPAPYRSLLVHEHDMTPTLEDAYRGSIQLRVLQYQLRDHVVARQVALIAEGSEKPVAFGAIKIHLEHFPPRARRLVLERQQPLGTILRAQGVEHTSHPNAFVRVTSPPVTRNALLSNAPGTS